MRLPNSAGLLAVSRLLATFLTLLTAPIVARSVGPEGRGAVSAALAAFALVPIVLAFGMPLNLRRLSLRESSDGYVRAARDITLTLFIPAVGIGYALGVTLFNSLDVFVQAVAVVGIASSPLTVSWMNDQSVLIAHRKFRCVAAIQLMQPLIYVVSIIFFWSFGRLNVGIVLVCYIAGSVATFAFASWCVPVSVRGHRSSRRDFLRGSGSFVGGAVAEAASNRLDQLLVLPLLGLYQAGLYSLAVTFSSLPMSFAHAVGAHYFSRYSEEENDQDSLVSESIRVILYLSFFVAGLLSLLCIVLVPFIFGRDFVPALPSIWISQAGSVLMCTSYVVSMVLVSRGSGRALTAAQISAVVASTSALLLIAPWKGAVGASLASSSGYLVLLVIVLYLAKVRMRDLFLRKEDVMRAVRIIKR
ncbi:oligosaccharide flippase family protein [Rhodococcus sp. BP-316]|uniref:lipopolysaccharide biosynthesis protein n=1 Tax=Rhodococcus sp. BP-316 TaxID=2739445 RepID=UPI001C9A9A75|nr:oligosaccharide flippase family protein [Rhodococcus sp. BP-316]MBY6683239.1 oligosaccharide flippase family protein [Rhodococcus sp. BP-316]